MVHDIRVLMTSLSKKVPFIEAVKRALQFFGPNSKLFGADLDAACIGQYFVDHFWNMPSVFDLKPKDIVEYCQQNEITRIIPTRNDELLWWANNKGFFLKHGIHLMVPDLEPSYICLDKMLFYQFLTEHQITTPQTSENALDIHSNLIVAKEKIGSGSKRMGLKLTQDEARVYARKLRWPMFQAYVEGPEYSVDIYIAKDFKIKGVVARKRVLVIDGESQVTETVRDQKLEDLCTTAALKLKLSGHVNFQAICEKESGNYTLIECNPRFGGASTLALRAGLDSFHWFFLESLNEPLPEFKRSENEIKMVRYAKDTFISL